MIESQVFLSVSDKNKHKLPTNRQATEATLYYTKNMFRTCEETHEIKTHAATP